MGLWHMEILAQGPPIASEQEWWAEAMRPVRLYASARVHPFSQRRQRALLALAFMDGVDEDAPCLAWRSSVVRSACRYALHDAAFGPPMPEAKWRREALRLFRSFGDCSSGRFDFPYPFYAIWGLCGPRGPGTPPTPREIVDAWLSSFGEPPGACACSVCRPMMAAACRCVRAAVPSPFADERLPRDEDSFRLACAAIGLMPEAGDSIVLRILADRLEEQGKPHAAAHLRKGWHTGALWPFAAIVEAWHGS